MKVFHALFALFAFSVHAQSSRRFRVAHPRASTLDPTSGCAASCDSSLSFAGAAAKAYEVGNDLSPEVPFRVKTSWAGNVPIGESTSRSLYFWLWGSEKPTDFLSIWLSGGPGCSSLGAVLQRTGPLLQPAGSSVMTPNKYSWTRESSMLFVEQPVGVGFTQGTPTAQNESDVAADFLGFLDNFYETFPELKSKKLYLTGESYAGQYIPAIASALYADCNRYNLQGVLIASPLMTLPDQSFQSDLVAYNFALSNNDVLKIPDAGLTNIRNAAEACGYVGYVETNLRYPPLGPLPAYNPKNCTSLYAWHNLTAEAAKVNKAYDYHRDTATTVPSPPSVLAGTSNLFNNANLQKAIHAPANSNWSLCKTGVFPHGDHSPAPFLTDLPAIIDAAPGRRTVIASGLDDALLPTNGTALAIQGMTWGGRQGLARAPDVAFHDVDGHVAGTYRDSRGLYYAQVRDAGHFLAGDNRPASLALFRALLRR